MDYWFDGTTSAGTLNFTTDTNIDCTSLTTYAPDPLIDWLPNSCLYTKYVPTWHLRVSYTGYTNDDFCDYLVMQTFEDWNKEDS